jgi:hypothetical protein
MGKGLFTALKEVDSFFDGRGVHISKSFYKPGYLVVLAAYLKKKNIAKASLYIDDSSNEQYFSALGLSLALWGEDDYSNCRKKVGVNYSMLTHLSHPDSPDEASAQINSCLRGMSETVDNPGMVALCHVVGELHDNVWAHGKQSGFSVCQRYEYDDDHILEFALADCGMGFLRELKRTGHEISDHENAIEWCIKEGNTTKPSNDRDEFAQRLPVDSMENPFGEDVETFEGDNHHQGLGLHHFVELASRYDGELYLASGNVVLHIDYNGNKEYLCLPFEWEGVAVSCSIKESCLNTDNKENNQYSAEVSALMEQMRAL